MRAFAIRGSLPEDKEERNKITQQLIRVRYGHVIDENGQYYMAIDYDINYPNKYGIEEVHSPHKLNQIREALERADGAG